MMNGDVYTEIGNHDAIKKELRGEIAKLEERVTVLEAKCGDGHGRTVYEQLFHEAVNFIRQRYPEWSGNADGQQVTLTGVANLMAAFVCECDLRSGGK